MSQNKPPFIDVDPHHLVHRHGSWVKAPGRIKVGFAIKAFGPAEKGARDLVASATRVNGFRVEQTEVTLANYLQAQLSLQEYLQTPHGNVPVTADSAAFRNLWHMFLLRGRELIDRVGPLVGPAFGLKFAVKGLNAEKFESLRKVIRQAQPKVAGLEPLIDCLDRHETALTQLIDVRNRDKDRDDTIKEPPEISEEGVASKGVVRTNKPGETLEFVSFFERSHEAVLHLVKTVLGGDPVAGKNPDGAP